MDALSWINQLKMGGDRDGARPRVVAFGSSIPAGGSPGDLAGISVQCAAALRGLFVVGFSLQPSGDAYFIEGGATQPLDGSASLITAANISYVSDNTTPASAHHEGQRTTAAVDGSFVVWGVSSGSTWFSLPVPLWVPSEEWFGIINKDDQVAWQAGLIYVEVP